MTPAGIEPATFRFVAQNLNLCYRSPDDKDSTRKSHSYNPLASMLFAGCNLFTWTV